MRFSARDDRGYPADTRDQPAQAAAYSPDSLEAARAAKVRRDKDVAVIVDVGRNP